MISPTYKCNELDITFKLSRLRLSCSSLVLWSLLYKKRCLPAPVTGDVFQPRYHLCTNLTLSALLVSYISHLRMTAVTLAPFTKPISFPEAAILMYSDGDCFSAHGKWVPITYFPVFDTIQYVFPRSWPFKRGVFPHLVPLDLLHVSCAFNYCLTGYMFSRAFHYCLTGYMFPRAFHYCLTGYLFSYAFHHCLTSYMFSRASHYCLTAYKFSCAFHYCLTGYMFPRVFHYCLTGYFFLRFSLSFIRLQVFPRFSSLPDWLHVFSRFFTIAWPVTCFLALFTDKSPLLDRLHAFARFSPKSPLLDWLRVPALFIVTWSWLQDFPRLANRASQNLKLFSLFFKLNGYREIEKQ